MTKQRANTEKMKAKKYSKLFMAKEAIKHRGFISKIPVVIRMIKYWRKGIYPVNSMDIILPLLGLVYVLSPIDLLPEIAIPFIGAIDDIAILSLTMPKLIKEVDKFLAWEMERKRNTQGIIDAEIIE